jgi:hypothetical protein
MRDQYGDETQNTPADETSSAGVSRRTPIDVCLKDGRAVADVRA